MNDTINTFTYDQESEPRFTNNDDHLHLKEEMAQFGDHIRMAIEAALKLEDEYFGECVRYGLCHEGAMGLFVKHTTGGGMLYRLRGIYLEDELIERYADDKEVLYRVIPSLIAHEIGHDFEYDYPKTQYTHTYSHFSDHYDNDEFQSILLETQIDAKAIQLLSKIDFDAEERLNTLLSLKEIELERFTEFQEEGRLDEIMGSKNQYSSFILKFARSIAIIRFFADKLTPEDHAFKTRIEIYLKGVKDFLETFDEYDEAHFDNLYDAFVDFLSQQQ